MRRLPFVVFAVVLLTAPAAAQDVEREAKAIEALLVAPCCWTQQVSVHRSEAATRIKQEVRVALRAGQSHQQILDAYVQTYGPAILADPPARGFGASLYVLPAVVLFGSALIVGIVVRRFAARRSTSAPAGGPSAVEDNALADELDHELRELD